MPSPIGLFSRRKNSDDKALRAALAPQGSPYLSSSSISSPNALNPLQNTAFPQPPHSAPLFANKKKGIQSPQLEASGFATENAGPLSAPHLSRAKTSISTSDDPQRVRLRKPLNRSTSSGAGRRSKSFDQRPPMEAYQEFIGAPPLDNSRSRSVSPLSHQGPALGVAVNYSRAGTPWSRLALSRDEANQSTRSYSPVSSISVYPISPPLSPESPLVSPSYRTGMAISLDPGVGYEPEAQRESRNDTQHASESGDSNRKNSGRMTQHSDTLPSIPISEEESAKEALTRELAALTFEFEPQSFGPLAQFEDSDTIQQSRQREFELVDTVNGKERELEFLRSNSHGYREQIAVMENVLAQKDQELENARIRISELSQNQTWSKNTPLMMDLSEMGVAEIGRKLVEEIRRRERAEKLLAETIAEEERKRGEIRAAAWREFEQTIHHEERIRGEVQNVLGEEEKRRAELNWLFGEKIEKIERLRRTDLEEFHKALAEAKEEKERLERLIKDNTQEVEQSRQYVIVQREANEELLEMTKKINTRLGEEKKKNRQLEEKINQITMDAYNNVSNANREVVMMKNVIEDKDTKIKFFETELAAMKKDNKAMEEGWKGLEVELDEARKSLLDRGNRLKSLEQENTEFTGKLEAHRRELDEIKQRVGAGEQPGSEEMKKKMELLKEDIELYKKDVKVYKKDVKKRDNQIKELKKSITELESLLESKTLETKVLQDALDALGCYREDSPLSNDSSGSESNPPFRDEVTALKLKLQLYGKEYRSMYEDHEALKKKHDLFVSQQAMVIVEMDEKLTRAKKERDAVEAAATRQLKKMRHGLLPPSMTGKPQLASAIGTALDKKYQSPLAITRKEDPSSFPQQPISTMKRAESKAGPSKRRTSIAGEMVGLGLSSIKEPAVRMEAVVRVVDEEEDFRERGKLGKMKNAYESAIAPDGGEVFEW